MHFICTSIFFLKVLYDFYIIFTSLLFRSGIPISRNLWPNKNHKFHNIWAIKSKQWISLKNRYQISTSHVSPFRLKKKKKKEKSTTKQRKSFLRHWSTTVLVASFLFLFPLIPNKIFDDIPCIKNFRIISRSKYWSPTNPALIKKKRSFQGRSPFLFLFNFPPLSFSPPLSIILNKL